jgi:N-acetylglucosaminyldiphosphoundecaprenol N-acetyl-beta-D-mannosaminyltransferase
MPVLGRADLDRLTRQRVLLRPRVKRALSQHALSMHPRFPFAAMSTTSSNPIGMPSIPFTVITPLPTTSKDAWDAPIFEIEEPTSEPTSGTTSEPASVATIEPIADTPSFDTPLSDVMAENAVLDAVVTEAEAAGRDPVHELADLPPRWRKNEQPSVAPVPVEAPIVAPLPSAEPSLPSPSPAVTHEHSTPQSPTPQLNPTKGGAYVRGETTEVWGVRYDRVRMMDAVVAIGQMIKDRIPRYVITANLNYAMLVEQDASLEAVNNDAAMILADGQPIVWRSRLGSAGRLPERVAGSELIYHLAERAAFRGWRIYFLGAEAGVAQRCADKLKSLYPGLQIAGVQSPPYRALSSAEQQQQRQSIIDARPDILLVAFGQPKGERWIHQHYQELRVPVSIQVGASFDFVAGTAKRAPVIWQKLGFEWCYRMFSNPSRLVPRYASNAAYLGLSLIRDWRDFVKSKFGNENQPKHADC